MTSEGGEDVYSAEEEADNGEGSGEYPLPAPADLARQRDEYLESLLRLQAEFDNYRKRVDRQQREIVENANAALVKKLLPVLDTADLALAHGGVPGVRRPNLAVVDVTRTTVI